LFHDRYLEEILRLNPSDHPTIVLSSINYAELSLIVDFMYTGEVAVEQEQLSKLLQAAKILKIKGLYESAASPGGGDMSADIATDISNVAQAAKKEDKLLELEEKEKEVQK
jgi:hypothetical protein